MYTPPHTLAPWSCTFSFQACPPTCINYIMTKSQGSRHKWLISIKSQLTGILAQNTWNMLVQVYFSSLLLTRYGDQKLWSDMQKETVYSDLQVSRASFMSHFVINHQSTNQSPSHSPHFTHGSSCTSFLPSLTPSLFHSAHNLLFSQVFPTTDCWYLTAGLPPRT